MAITIRPFEQNDFPAWLSLWDGNNMGTRNEEVTAETWSRILDQNFQVNGLGAFEGEELLGLVHYILHPTTGYINPVCYMQDVYVDPAHRQKGIATLMVSHVGKLGRQEKWGRLYWLAENNNTAAQELYKNLGVKLDFALHVLPLD